MSKNLIRSFFADESGATAIEYALIASIVSVGIAAGVTQFSTALNDTFTNVASYFAPAQ